MIKVKNKGKLNINYFLFIGLAFLAILLVRYMIQTSDYVAVEATVKQVTVDTSSHGYTSSDSKASKKYVTYVYNVDGKEYTADQQVLFTSRYKVGMRKNIKYNPKNPNEIYNVLYVRVCVFIMAFLTLFILATKKFIKRQ